MPPVPRGSGTPSKDWIAERIIEGVLDILVAYALIGQLHVAYFYVTVSRLDCINAEGRLLWHWCHHGYLLADIIVGFFWPFYWL